MIKKVPNILSVSRIVVSVFLILCMLDYEKGRIPFLILFFYCGISDILDGYIARHYDASSDLGSKIDAYADAQFIIISFGCFLYLVFKKQITLDTTPYLVTALIFGILFKLNNYIITLIKFKFLNGLHTLLNKYIGSSFFFMIPVIVYLKDVPMWLQYYAIISWFIAAYDEMASLVILKEFDSEYRGILGKVLRKKS